MNCNTLVSLELEIKIIIQRHSFSKDHSFPFLSLDPCLCVRVNGRGQGLRAFITY